MKSYDAVVIGGGVLGCFTARNLRKWKISTLLIEKERDVCTGITRANSAICYAGYDNRPKSRKAEMTVRGNASYERLCEELEVPFSRCGSLLVTYEDACISQLRRKLENGRQNGAEGLWLLAGEEAEAMEPMLRSGVRAALYAPSTGTVNPWQLGIAAFENSVYNGAKAALAEEVKELRRTESGFEVVTDRSVYACRMVFNCAGLQADRVRELLFPPAVRLRMDGAEYLVFDRLAKKPQRILFHQAKSCGKGITAVPCAEGNLLISGIRKPVNEPFATTPEGLRELYEAAKALLPELDLTKVIRSFGAVRPNPYTDAGESLPDFCIDCPHPGFYSLIGVKTPGLTCADELGRFLAGRAAAYLQADPNPLFVPHRRAITERAGEMVCYCESVTRAEILEAIRRGAVTADGVKRRTGACMGRCQGSRCTYAIEKLLEEYSREMV